MTQDNNNQTSLFQKQLEDKMGTKLRLKINDNRSTMLSVKWEPDYTKVSLHRMFLQAPQNIMQALACYLKREDQRIAPSITAFIEKQLPKLDYSHELDLSKLQTRGQCYDIQKIYHDLNQEYFHNALDLHITWFGLGRKKRCNQVTFGLFHDPLRLIKINRLIDNKHFPDYFVSYVIFHEMLHAVCPVVVDERGIKQIHSPAFKKREKTFKYYDPAQKWLQENHHFLFTVD